MHIPAQTMQTLMEKIRTLPPERVAEVEDFVDFLRGRTESARATNDKEPLDFPVDDLGPWPQGLSLRREDMSADDGR
jgi:hypothetical protein